MDFAKDGAADYDPPARTGRAQNFISAIDRDPIASLRSAIRTVCIIKPL